MTVGRLEHRTIIGNTMPPRDPNDDDDEDEDDEDRDAEPDGLCLSAPYPCCNACRRA
jgi:hypothetical protein